MKERPENIEVLCAVGIMLLMGALASAIFLGTSQLVTPEFGLNRSLYYQSAGFLLILLSLAGGYLVSYGFIMIFYDQKQEQNAQLE